MRPGATYDTGMLVALERSKERAWGVHETLVRREIRITVPSAVIAEWWRGRTDDREDLLAQIRVPLGDEESRIARIAGEALATLRRRRSAGTRPSKHLVDAVVMATAARTGDVVYTGDIDDLMRLRAFFPGVRLLSV